LEKEEEIKELIVSQMEETSRMREREEEGRSVSGL
jgi:hypothetical protein